MRLSTAATAAVLLGAASAYAQSSKSSSSSTATSALKNSSASTTASTIATSSSSASSNSSATSDALPAPSSNYTLPAPAATATLPPGFVVQQSTPFVFQKVDTADIPTIKYSLLNETVAERLSICKEQVSFCQTAGCAESDATIKDNFCNSETMGVACTCTKGASNLNQFKWPVQFADCLRRGSTCKNMCLQPDSTVSDRYACRQACDNAFSATCGFPNQYAADYAVSKVSQKPQFNMIQGGTANGAARLAAGSVATMAVAAAVALLI